MTDADRASVRRDAALVMALFALKALTVVVFVLSDGPLADSVAPLGWLREEHGLRLAMLAAVGAVFYATAARLFWFALVSPPKARTRAEPAVPAHALPAE